MRALSVSTTSGVGSPAPGLYAGGRFDEAGGEPAGNIAHWNGLRWREVGAGAVGHTYSLFMFDEDGAGPGEANLFVGGIFFEVAGIDKPGLVRWDGSGYSAVGGGLLGFYFGDMPNVKAMIEFDEDGPGPRGSALYAAGSFAYADGIRVNSIARWDGSNWEAMGNGLGSGVNALAVFDADGPGPGPPMLYAGGGFITRDPAGNWLRTLARWNGT
ncbi:MAG: hypothetical protein IID31_05635, partial [Planctomycetes bacterium]|nr:hypothetical protein [Planctomycetota bacterium]